MIYMYSSMNLFIDCAGSHDLAQTTVSVIGTNLSHMVCVSAECINIMISLQLCLHSSTQDVLYNTGGEMQYNVYMSNNYSCNSIYS